MRQGFLGLALGPNTKVMNTGEISLRLLRIVPDGISGVPLQRMRHNGRGKGLLMQAVLPYHTLCFAEVDKQPVAPSLKQRFGDWIDARTAQGIETYGGPLTTDNGRDAERDMLEELLDFCQYQEQSRLELLADNARLRARIGVARERLGLPALEGY